MCPWDLDGTHDSCLRSWHDAIDERAEPPGCPRRAAEAGRAGPALRDPSTARARRALPRAGDLRAVGVGVLGPVGPGLRPRTAGSPCDLHRLPHRRGRRSRCPATYRCRRATWARAWRSPLGLARRGGRRPDHLRGAAVVGLLHRAGLARPHHGGRRLVGRSGRADALARPGLGGRSSSGRRVGAVGRLHGRGPRGRPHSRHARRLCCLRPRHRRLTRARAPRLADLAGGCTRRPLAGSGGVRRPRPGGGGDHGRRAARARGARPAAGGDLVGLAPQPRRARPADRTGRPVAPAGGRGWPEVVPWHRGALGIACIATYGGVVSVGGPVAASCGATRCTP